mmetsp:Transcript_12369/g.35259  ORF Transcript_12369/g.35259 Transcript_12369/m.35259 type:complete len:309 (-) Transcript_12369:108-1034(-)
MDSASLQYLLGVSRLVYSSPGLLSPAQLTFTDDNPLLNVITVTTTVIAAVYVLGLSTGNHSFVDKCWSIVPVYYAWQFGLAELSCASPAGFPRAAVAACIITVWGLRLSYNFYRKGGYKWDGEDYRWEVLRNSMSPALYHVFHFFFIAIAQNLLLTAITLPLAVSWHTTCVAKKAVPFNGYDALAIIACIFCLLIEAVADQEQFDFHQRKHAGRLHASEKKLGFLADGLFAFSRHPNFFAEQCFWVGVCFFASASTGQWAGWWCVGVAGLIALFHGSTNFTEEISSGKYPGYAGYKKSVNRLVPRIEF